MSTLILMAIAFGAGAIVASLVVGVAAWIRKYKEKYLD